MPHFIKVLIGMARVARPWEYAFLAGLVALTMLAMVSGGLGIPRLLGGFMALICIFMACGALFIIDNVRTRYDHAPRR